MIWTFIQLVIWLALGAIVFLTGWGAGYRDGREEAQLRIEKMRRAVNANRQG